MVTACVIGDVINVSKNYIAAINTEGWLFIFHLSNSNDTPTIKSNISTDSNVTNSNVKLNLDVNEISSAIKLTSFYEQRMPANCKELLLADLDGDGQNEVIVGLTDRVLRTYKWIKIGDSDRGKFVGLYKWEFADQIGAVSLNPSRHENCQDIIVAQPGGTYAKLECSGKKLSPTEEKQQPELPERIDENSLFDSPTDYGDNVRTEYINKLTPEYHQLAISQMRNHHISTEVLGGIRHKKKSDSYSLIVIATLDGTLMLVNKDEILWSLQVDHQLFALAALEINNTTRSKSSIPQSDSSCTIVSNLDLNVKIRKELPNDSTSQYFVVCAWNGKTYIIDEERNYLRFKFEEAVSAFTAGNYYFDGVEHSSLVYATFNNQIILYYDVILDHIRPIYLLDEVINNPEHEELLTNLKKISADIYNCDNPTTTTIYNLLNDILYSINDF